MKSIQELRQQLSKLGLTLLRTMREAGSALPGSIGIPSAPRPPSHQQAISALNSKLTPPKTHAKPNGENPTSGAKLRLPKRPSSASQHKEPTEIRQTKTPSVASPAASPHSPTQEHTGQPQADLDGGRLFEKLAAWRKVSETDLRGKQSALKEVKNALDSLAKRAGGGDEVALEWLVNAAAAGSGNRDAASLMASNHLIGLVCDPKSKVKKELLTEYAANLVGVNSNNDKRRLEEHVPIELAYLVAARSKGPHQKSAEKMLTDTFGAWEKLGLGSTHIPKIHAADRTVSMEEIVAGAKRFGTHLDSRKAALGTPPRPVVQYSEGHFYVDIPCMHNGKLSWLTVDPYKKTHVDRHSTKHQDFVVYGDAQKDTPNACGPIVLALLTSLQTGHKDPQSLPTRDELRANVETHFNDWNTKLTESDRQWAVAGVRAAMLSELESTDGFRNLTGR
jgi:hypothetical protein